MKTIRCPCCDEQILVVPDLKVMARAIDRHVDQHRQRGDNALATLMETVQVLQSLTEQTLREVSVS